MYRARRARHQLHRLPAGLPPDVPPRLVAARALRVRACGHLRRVFEHAPTFGIRDQSLHQDYIQRWVGGQMGVVATSAYDPIFWSHHCTSVFQ